MARNNYLNDQLLKFCFFRNLVFLNIVHCDCSVGFVRPQYTSSLAIELSNTRSNRYLMYDVHATLKDNITKKSIATLRHEELFVEILIY